MLNTIGWLDFGAAEHRKALHLLDQLRERDTVDELGLGVIRDAFAERLFPGISTIQTRAKYFLIIPWIYRGLETKKVSSAEFARRAKAEEVRVIKSLSHLGQRQGVIGIDAKERLKRFPSSIYWYGLGRLGIRRFHGSQRDYFAAIDRYYARHAAVGRTREDDPAHLEAGPNWDRALPPQPMVVDTLDLTRDEAAYLQERIQFSANESLLAAFCRQGSTTLEIEQPWDHPATQRLAPDLAEDLQHARNFSDTAWLATLQYQFTLAALVAKEKGPDAEVAGLKRDEIAEEIELAKANLLDRQDALAEWSRERFWQRLAIVSQERISGGARRFVDAWLDLTVPVIKGHPLDEQKAVQLISSREESLKGALARVRNAEARRRWVSQAAPKPMDYRWSATVRTVVLDIQEGLAR